jgi:hypothetical protein
MKNKLQRFIKHIKTMLYKLWLCVSLKRDTNTTEKDLHEKEKCGKIGKIVFKLLGENFMIWNLKDYGDIIEKESIDFIKTNGLVGYQTFWNNFIGNLNGKPAFVENISDDDNTNRELIGQWNYVILKNLVTIERLLVNKYNTHKFRLNFSEIISYDRDLMLVTQLTYNNIEILDKIKNLINDTKNEFYKEKFRGLVDFRNLLSHNIKPLTLREDGKYYVPKTFEWFTTNGNDHKKIIWSTFNQNEIEWCQLNEFMRDRKMSIITDFKDIITEEQHYFDNMFKKGRYKLCEPPIYDKIKNTENVSGNTFITLIRKIFKK